MNKFARIVANEHKFKDIAQITSSSVQRRSEKQNYGDGEQLIQNWPREQKGAMWWLGFTTKQTISSSNQEVKSNCFFEAKLCATFYRRHIDFFTFLMIYF